MAVTVTPKAPADLVDYTVRFKGLGSDTIASIDVVGAGITIDSPAPSHDNTDVVFWVSGGSAGTTGTVTVEITTAAARVISREIDIPIELI